MSNETVHCVVLKQDAEALDSPPYPGELGRRVFANVSKGGWAQWLVRLTAIINENGLNTSDPKSLELIEKHMQGFFFGEGDYGQLPAGFHAAGASK
ncbi:oxidative damage protection protein [Candidatus Spongiihabitans sp.]|uniref:oxidative damage protection protein n=1 Tax=Candidatus Spongiihabitans sp. TaxID=3101308 RepID=UPI003C7D5353